MYVCVGSISLAMIFVTFFTLFVLGDYVNPCLRSLTLKHTDAKVVSNKKRVTAKRKILVLFFMIMFLYN